MGFNVFNTTYLVFVREKMVCDFSIIK